MDHIHHASPEIAAEPSFGQRFMAVTERSLSPENIETYADDALRDVIDVVSDAIATYADDERPVSAELERESMLRSGLDPNTIETTLDRISFVADEIRELDTLLEDVTIHVDTVITPPDSRNVNILPSDGSFQEKHTISRFKTVAFLLHNRFGVDLKDSEQITITAGALRGDMMRNEGYKMLQLPELNRTILVCDAEGNASFVLDSEKLSEYNISTETLMTMSKDDLNEYLSSHYKAGERLVYSENFVDKVASLLEIIPGRGESIESNMDSSKILKNVEKAPEDVMSERGMSLKFKVSRQVVKGAILALHQDLKDVKLYRFNQRTAPGYNNEQQDTIYGYLLEKGAFTEAAPEDMMSIAGIALELGVHHDVVTKAIAGIGSDLGEIADYKFFNKVVPGFDATQQDKIRQFIEGSGGFAEDAPDGVLSARGLASGFRIDNRTITETAEELGSELGDVKRYNFRGKVTQGFDEIQQRLIVKRLREKGLIEEIAPDDVVSAGALAKKLGANSTTITKAITELAPQLGDVKQYRFGSVTTFGYNAAQQREIIEWLKTNGGAKIREKLAVTALQELGL